MLRIAVLSKTHQLGQAARDEMAERAGAPADVPQAPLDNPCADPRVRELMAKTRRGYAQRGVRVKKQRALPADPLELLLATCDETPLGLRDRALLSFAWASGGRRRSEVTHAVCENLQLEADGDYVHLLSQSKTNQSGAVRPEDSKPVQGRAARAMKA